jgi:hypothetical protein
MQKDYPLWRAQLGYELEWDHPGAPYAEEVPAAYGPKRMKPTPSYAKDGRINPHGIAYLYLATDRDTACAEVRPWLGAYISVGFFSTNREIRLVDCTSDQRRFPFRAFTTSGAIPWPPEEYEGVVWGEIGAAMTLPIAPVDSRLGYIPTQIIAEAILETGVDGIAYKSQLVDEGVNIALFNLEDATLHSCQLMEAAQVRFKFDESDNPYYVRAKKDPPNTRDLSPPAHESTFEGPEKPAEEKASGIVTDGRAQDLGE